MTNPPLQRGCRKAGTRVALPIAWQASNYPVAIRRARASCLNRKVAARTTGIHTITA